MGGEITERPRASGIAIEAPDLLVGVAPVLQVAAAKVTEVAEVAGLDQLTGQADGRNEAVVEGAHVLHTGHCDASPDLVALVASRPSGFSQTTCLPASAARIVGSAWRSFGPRLSKRPISGSATSSRQLLVQRSNP